MKITSTLLTVSLSIFITEAVVAQTINTYSDYSIILKADSSSRSVLLSNLLEKESGNQSPFIGTAAWTDQGRQLQCRSLLFFNYGVLPKVIRPEQISSAQLILVPLQLNNTMDNNDKQFSKFMVQRVIDPWEDSLANWSNQPLTDHQAEVIKYINPKKKDKPVKIDVTEIVKKMFLNGNNGFMIKYEDPRAIAAAYSHWFASVKNEEEELRPLLVITLSYRAPAYTTLKDVVQPLPMTARDRKEMMDNYIRPEPVAVTPAPEVKPPIKDQENN